MPRPGLLAQAGFDLGSALGLLTGVATGLVFLYFWRKAWRGDR